MKDRIKQIRKSEGLTQKEFAERLGIKQNTVATYEMGRIGVSDAVIVSICREFGINEEWLRTGKGDMKISANSRLASYLADIAHGDDDFIVDLIEVYRDLDQTSKDALRLLADRMAEKRNGRR